MKIIKKRIWIGNINSPVWSDITIKMNTMSTHHARYVVAEGTFDVIKLTVCNEVRDQIGSVYHASH